MNHDERIEKLENELQELKTLTIGTFVFQRAHIDAVFGTIFSTLTVLMKEFPKEDVKKVLAKMFQDISQTYLEKIEDADPGLAARIDTRPPRVEVDETAVRYLKSFLDGKIPPPL